MNIVDDFFTSLDKLRKYVGRALGEVEDCRDYFWQINYDEVRFAESEEELRTGEGNCYVNEVLSVKRIGNNVFMWVDDGCGNGNITEIFNEDKERPDMEVE